VFLLISILLSAEVYSTVDSIITIQPGTTVVGFTPSPAVEKTEISIVGTAIIFGKDEIHQAKIIDAEPEDKDIKKELVKPVFTQVNNITKKLPSPKITVYFKNPIPETYFLNVSSQLFLAVFSIVVPINILQNSAFVFLTMLFFFLCLFFGHRIFNFSQHFTYVCRVRPPPVFYN
jgi:hypothetical protein